MFLLSGMKKMIQRMVKNNKKKVPVYIPVLHGNLLIGRTALITGGTSGIGFSIAKVFLQNGATVVITGRNQERLDLAVNQLKEINCSVYGFVLDCADTKSFQVRFLEIVQNLNNIKIDILVNNAGINKGSVFGNTTEEDYEDILNSNMKGTFFISNCCSIYEGKQYSG